jgi:hypothetical protein
MNTEKNINICGKDVKLRYCAATETGFEQLASKSIGDIDFNSQEDLLRLSVAAIIAAYQRDGQEAPIESKEILFYAKPKEIIELFKAVLEARAAWYDVPLVLEESIKAEQTAVSDASPSEEEKPKNA